MQHSVAGLHGASQPTNRPTDRPTPHGGRARGTRRSRPDKAPDMRFLLPHRAAHFNAWLPGYLYFNWISVENATPNLTAPRNEPPRRSFWFHPIESSRDPPLLGIRFDYSFSPSLLSLYPYSKLFLTVSYNYVIVACHLQNSICFNHIREDGSNLEWN